ncbi:MAG: hypothetical protein ACK5B6_14245 [Bacteroidia bacterium]|jgi:hypothetical protein
MQREIKCKHCGEWNTLGIENVNCSTCAKPLSELSADDKASMERRNSAGEINIRINPNDPWILRLLKRTFNLVQLIFLSILSLIVWIIFAGPG